MAKLLNSTSNFTVVLAARGGVGKSVIAAVLPARRAKRRDKGSRREQTTLQNLDTAAPIAPQGADSVAPVASTATTEAPNFSISQGNK